MTTAKMVTPDWAAPFVTRFSSFTFHNVTHQYAVLRDELGTQQGAPAMFTIQVEEFLGVSVSYPEEWRELGLIHEILEHTILKDEEHCCLLALVAELLIAAERGVEMHAYVSFRQKFFANLVAYYENKERSGHEDAILAGMKLSLAHLNKLLAE